MTIAIGGALKNFTYPAGYSGPTRSNRSGETQGAGASDISRAIEDLMAEATKTPAERARDAVLKKHGLDNKAYGALDADSRKIIDAEVAEAVKRTIGTREKAESSFMRMA